MCTPIVDFIIILVIIPALLQSSVVFCSISKYSVADFHKCYIMLHHVIWEKQNMLFTNTISSLDYCHWKENPMNRFFFFLIKQVKFSKTSWILTILWSGRFSINWSCFAWVDWILYQWRKNVVINVYNKVMNAYFLVYQYNFLPAFTFVGVLNSCILQDLVFVVSNVTSCKLLHPWLQKQSFWSWSFLTNLSTCAWGGWLLSGWE